MRPGPPATNKGLDRLTSSITEAVDDARIEASVASDTLTVVTNWSAPNGVVIGSTWGSSIHPRQDGSRLRRRESPACHPAGRAWTAGTWRGEMPADHAGTKAFVVTQPAGLMTTWTSVPTSVHVDSLVANPVFFPTGTTDPLVPAASTT